MRRQRKQNILVRIGKILLNIVLVGTAIVTTYVMADNGLFKNTWNNMTQQEQVQEEVQDETKDDAELPGEDAPEVDAGEENKTPEVEPGTETEPEEDGEEVIPPPVVY